VHGKDQAEHDIHLELVIKRLRERGLTLNETKCQFRMDKLIFVGKAYFLFNILGKIADNLEL